MTIKVSISENGRSCGEIGALQGPLDLGLVAFPLLRQKLFGQKFQWSQLAGGASEGTYSIGILWEAKTDPPKSLKGRESGEPMGSWSSNHREYGNGNSRFQVVGIWWDSTCTVQSQSAPKGWNWPNLIFTSFRSNWSPNPQVCDLWSISWPSRCASPCTHAGRTSDSKKSSEGILGPNVEMENFRPQRPIDFEWFWHSLTIFVCLNWYVRPKDSRDSGKVLGPFSDWAGGPGNFADIFRPLLGHVDSSPLLADCDQQKQQKRHEKTM